MNLNWADNLRAAIEGLPDQGSTTELMLEWLHCGERHIDACLNTIDALADANADLADANADLRRQLHELKATK